MSDGANQKAPQASQLRLARRRPEFFGQAHERRDLLQLPCSPRSDLAHAALNSAAAQPLVAHELAFHKLLQIFCLLFFFARRGRGRGVHGRRQRGRSATRHPPTGPPRAAPGGARRAPTGHPQIFLAELLGGRRQLGPLDGAWGPKIDPRGDVRKIRGSCCRVFSARFRVRTRTGSPPSAGRKAGGVDGRR